MWFMIRKLQKTDINHQVRDCIACYKKFSKVLVIGISLCLIRQK